MPQAVKAVVTPSMTGTATRSGGRGVWPGA
jgi:hypothetical protein